MGIRELRRHGVLFADAINGEHDEHGLFVGSPVPEHPVVEEAGDVGGGDQLLHAAAGAPNRLRARSHRRRQRIDLAERRLDLVVDAKEIEKRRAASSALWARSEAQPGIGVENSAGTTLIVGRWIALSKRAAARVVTV
jgi:hypothetical protein